jgi:hypothetical protein
LAMKAEHQIARARRFDFPLTDHRRRLFAPVLVRAALPLLIFTFEPRFPRK